MFPITTTNETVQETSRVKSLAEANVKNTVVNKKVRRLCSVYNCQRQAQRKGLCAKHITEENKKRQSTKSSSSPHQSSAHLLMEDFEDTTLNSRTVSVALTRNPTEQNTFHDQREFFCS